MAIPSSSQTIRQPTSVAEVAQETTVQLVFGLVWSPNLVGKAGLSGKLDYKTNLLLGLSKLRRRYALASPVERSIIRKSHVLARDVVEISPSIGEAIGKGIFSGSFFEQAEVSDRLIRALVESDDCYTFLQSHLRNEATNCISCTTEPESTVMFLVLGFAMQINGNDASYTGFEDLFDAWMRGNNNPLYHPRMQISESESRIHALVWTNRETIFVPAACPEGLQDLMSVGRYDDAFFLTAHWSSSTADFDTNVAQLADYDIYDIPANASGSSDRGDRSALYRESRTLDQTNIDMLNLLRPFAQVSYIPIHQLFYPFGCSTSTSRFDPSQFLGNKQNETLQWSFAASNIRLDEGVLVPQAHHHVVLDVLKRAIAAEAEKAVLAQFVDDQETPEWIKFYTSLQPLHISASITSSQRVLAQLDTTTWPGLTSTVNRIASKVYLDDASATVASPKPAIDSLEQQEAWLRFSSGIRMPPSPLILPPGQDSISDAQVQQFVPDNALRYKAAIGTLGNRKRQEQEKDYNKVILQDSGFKPSTGALEVVNLGALTVIEKPTDERSKYEQNLYSLLERCKSFFLAASLTHPLGGIGYLYTNYHLDFACIFSTSTISVQREAIGLVNEARRRLHLAEQVFCTETRDAAQDLHALPSPFLWMYIDESVDSSRPVKMQLRTRQGGAIRIISEWDEAGISTIWNGLYKSRRLIDDINGAFGNNVKATSPGLLEREFASQFGDLSGSVIVGGSTIFAQPLSTSSSFLGRLATSASNMLQSTRRRMLAIDECADSNRLIPVYGQLVKGNDLVSIEGDTSGFRTLASYLAQAKPSTRAAAGLGFLQWLTCTQLVNCFVSVAAALVHLDARGMTHVSVTPETIIISQTKQAYLGECAANLGMYDTIVILPSRAVGEFSIGKIERIWSIRLFGRLLRETFDALSNVFDFERYNTIGIASKTDASNRRLLLDMFGMIKSSQEIAKIVAAVQDLASNCINNAESLGIAYVYASLLPIQIYAQSHCE